MKKVIFAAAILAAVQILVGAGFASAAKKDSFNVNGRTATLERQIDAASK